MPSLIATILQRDIRHYLLAWTTRAKRGPVDHQGHMPMCRKKKSKVVEIQLLLPLLTSTSKVLTFLHNSKIVLPF